tara:strand:- start:581 stop:1630 length:1050 start_codon:yes stop_codon:yes gene_type:complete
MNSVNVDGKNYVKAKDLARDLGYTADYVGQLCRAGKVDAQLVGRSWYVNEESLQEHKRGRYRSNKQETIKEVARTLRAKDVDDDSHKITVHLQDGEENKNEGYANQSFYTRATAPATATKYHTDEAELIPGADKNISKTGRIGVRLADAQNLKITSKGKTFDFDPTQRQQLRFRGKLSVLDVEDELEVADEDELEEKKLLDQKTAFQNRVAQKTFTGEVSEIKNDKAERKTAEKTSKINVKHRRPTTKRKKRDLPFEHNSQGVLSMQRERIVGRNPVGGTLRVDTHATVDPVSPGRRTFLVVTTTLMAIILGVLVTSVEQTTTIVNGEVVVRYTLDFENIVAAAYDAFR